MTYQTSPILLVEDDPNAVFLIERAFGDETSANALQVAPDGDRAVAYLSGANEYADRQRYPVPALMLLDVRLPRKSGLEVLAWVRQQPGLRRLPVIMLTSSREPNDVTRAYDLGVNSYLVKPASASSLREMVKAIHRYWLVLNERPELHFSALHAIQGMDESLLKSADTDEPDAGSTKGHQQ